MYNVNTPMVQKYGKFKEYCYNEGLVNIMKITPRDDHEFKCSKKKISEKEKASLKSSGF